MTFNEVSKQLPPVDADGHSEFVLAYRGNRTIPEIVQYCNGDYGQKGWYRQDGLHIPFSKGRGQFKAPTFKFWSKIEYPQE